MKLFEFKNNIWLFGLVLLAVFAVSVGVRFQQFETWKKTPQAYFVGERPMMTTLDAPYWLRWAREYNEGVYEEVVKAFPVTWEMTSTHNISKIHIYVSHDNGTSWEQAEQFYNKVEIDRYR